jgi:phage terminase large subunit
MLKISRADVVSDHIIEGLPNAFLKLPITRLLNTLNVEPLPSQIAIVNAVNKYRFVCAAVSRRQGKTYIANIIGHCVSLVPGSNILIMSPNYNLSQISFELQRQLIKYHELEVEKDNAKDKVIQLANGSTIRMGSVNQADSVVGRSYDLIIFDEAAIADGEDAFNVQLRPTLDKDNARAIFISTPRGKNNWFSKFWDRGFSSEFPEWCSIHATYHENPRMNEDDVREAEASMSKSEFAQEYLASFERYEGQIWQINDECIRDHDITPENRHKVDVLAGLDLGFKDPTAMVVIGYNYEEDKYYVLDEYFRVAKTTSKHAARIQELINKWDIDFIYIDSAAQQTRYDLARDYDIATINANKKSVTDSIGFVASIIDSDRLIIPPSMEEVLKAIDGYQWNPNENLVKEKPLHNMASHMADAIRYALYSHTSSVGSM